MKWFIRKPKESSPGGEAPAEALKNCETGRRFYREAVCALLETLKAYTLEDDAEKRRAFIVLIDDLAEKLVSEETAARIEPVFHSSHGTIVSHLRDQKESLTEKENEYREIIRILTKAMADINADNRMFTDRIFQQSEKMEEITRLGDIKSIRTRLKREISSLQKAVKDKQAQDAKVIDLLSDQVNTLKEELAASQQAFMRDGLTGLYNEQALNRYLKGLIKQGAGACPPFSMLVIDIDNYDKIEETYGAALGQRVILAASQECRNIFRKDEFVARYKRGTFVVVLPSEPSRNAVQKSKQLSRIVAAKRYQIDENLSGHTLSFSVSIGVSSTKARDTASAVTGRAIQSLYTARRHGTGQVVSDKTLFMMFKRGGGETLADL